MRCQAPSRLLGKTGTTWIELIRATSPRRGAGLAQSLAFLPASGQLVLFPGAQDEGVTSLDDTQTDQ